MTTSFKTAPPPISTGFPGNAGSPREASMVALQQNNKLISALNSTSKGGRKYRYMGGDGKISVPIMKPLFSDPSAGTSQSVQNVTLSGVGQYNQLSMNNQLTGSVVSPAQPIPTGQLPVKTGGSCGCDLRGGRTRRRSKRIGGTRIMGPNQTWGCYSGGKRKRRKRKVKTEKKRKSKRTLSKKRRSTRRR
jgi:hypothetical protein